jgi:hypothetical protein
VAAAGSRGSRWRPGTPTGAVAASAQAAQSPNAAHAFDRAHSRYSVQVKLRTLRITGTAGSDSSRCVCARATHGEAQFQLECKPPAPKAFVNAFAVTKGAVRASDGYQPAAS